MFLFSIIFLLAGFNLFSAENLVTVLVGFIATTGLTQWIKKQSGLQGVGAMLLAIGLSVFVALAAIVVSMFLNDGGFSFEKIAGSAVQIFALATIAYKLQMDKQ
jgi:hypothetical protein